MAEFGDKYRSGVVPLYCITLLALHALCAMRRQVFTLSSQTSHLDGHIKGSTAQGSGGIKQLNPIQIIQLSN